MATYAIGDIQGCYHAFQALLARLKFNPNQDQLWLVGDLINRGTGSLEVLRWCFDHQDSIKIVLGNHDLHAIAVAHHIRPPHRFDTLKPLLEAKDRQQLLDWLRWQPLMVSEQNYVMVHAGLLPQWHVEQALKYATEVASALRDDDYIEFLTQMYGNQPDLWHEDLTGMDRLRAMTNVFTRMRVCNIEGKLNFEFKGELADIPLGFMPWFDVPSRVTKNQKIICGHWSALGMYTKNNIFALDTGCLWGGQLTAMCLENQNIYQAPFDKRDKD